MFEKFLSGNTRDFQQRYEGTYGWYCEDGQQKLLARLEEVGQRVVSFVDSRGVKYTLNADTQKNIGFHFLPPMPRYYNTPDGVMLVKRIAQRQFSRGISNRNTRIDMLTLRGLAQQEVDFPKLEAIFLHAITPDKAIKSKMDAVAISGQFAFFYDPKKVTNGPLYLFEKKVGTVMKTDDLWKVTLDEPLLFKTEVLDAFRNAGEKVEVS